MTVMGTTHNTQPVTTPAAPLDRNKYAELQGNAWWILQIQDQQKSTSDKLGNLYSAIAMVCRMQTMLTRECSRLLAEEAEDMSPTDRAIYDMINKF
jgi:hypothetical protein